MKTSDPKPLPFEVAFLETVKKSIIDGLVQFDKRKLRDAFEKAGGLCMEDFDREVLGRKS